MSKKKIHEKGRRLTAFIAGIAMIVGTAASLGVATYAWFTRGTGASATGFNFSASAAEGVLISTDVLDWKSHVLATDFTTKQGVGQAQEGNRISINDMEPTSTNAFPTAGELTFFGVDYNEDAPGGGAYSITANQTDFLVFDIYFNNIGNENLTLRLTESSYITDGEGGLLTSYSTRVAFLDQGSMELGEADNPNTADIIALSGASSTDDVYVWEPNSTLRSPGALAKGVQAGRKYVYNPLTSIGNDILADQYGFIPAGGNTGSITTNDIKLGDKDNITVLPALKVTKLTVYVWMEGQDIDNDNSVASGEVNINLDFETGFTALTGVTASGLSGDELTVTSGGQLDAGVVYTAYVILESQNGAHGYTYRALIATASATVQAEDGNPVPLTAIGFEDDVPAGTYKVVIVGRSNGKISTITQATNIVVA